MEDLKKVDQSKNFKTWIFAIAKNASLDLLKKKKPMPFSRIAEEDDAVEAVLAPYVAVPEASDIAFDQGFSRRILIRCSPNCRPIIATSW